MKPRPQRFVRFVIPLTLATAVLADAPSPPAPGEAAQAALALLRSDAPPADKALACKRLALYGQADAVPALAPLLADPQLASWARIALEAIPGPAADEALRAAVGSLRGGLLVGVINSLGVRRDPRAVHLLTAMLKDADPEVAAAAALALGHIGGDRARKALLAALPQAPARSAVAQGCILCAEELLAQKHPAAARKIYDRVRRANVPPQRVREATRGAILARGADGIPLLLETLRAADQAMFGMGLSVARELPGRAVTEALVAELGKTPPDRQGPLLSALGDRTDEAVGPVVLAAARRGPKPLRLVALELLPRLGDTDSVAVLLDAVVDSDADLAQAAKTALAALPVKDVDAQLCARLPQAAGHARRALIQLAGERQVRAATPELLRACRDADTAIRAAAIKALGETAGVDDLGALTDLLAAAGADGDLAVVEDALASACARLTDKAACGDRLLAALPASTTPVRCALLRVLAEVGTDQALAAVRSALAGPDPAVRDTAIRVLADWPEPAALPALLEVWRTTADDTHQFLALRGCARLLELSHAPAAEKVKTCAELLARTERDDDRKVLLSTLANVADPAALRLVEPLLGNAEVRAEAELALLKIATGLAKSAPADARAAAARLQAESQNPATRDKAARLLGELQ